MLISTPGWANDTSSAESQCEDSEESSGHHASCDAPLWPWLAGSALVAASVAALHHHNQDDDPHPSSPPDVTPDSDPLPDITPDNDPTPDVPPNSDTTPVVPPDSDPTPDSGDIPDPEPENTPLTFSNGVVVDVASQTVSFDKLAFTVGYYEDIKDYALDNVSLGYTRTDDETTLSSTGEHPVALLNINRRYVTDDDALVMEGTQTYSGNYWQYTDAGSWYWKYDSAGNLWLATASPETRNQTAVMTGDDQTNALTSIVAADPAIIHQIISGDRTLNTLSGNILATGEEGTALVVTGDNTLTTLHGNTLKVHGYHNTGVVISGNHTQTEIASQLDVSGGTAVVLYGHDARLTLSGEKAHTVTSSDTRQGTSTGIGIEVAGSGTTATIAVASAINVKGSSLTSNTALLIDGSGTSTQFSGTLNAMDAFATLVQVTDDSAHLTLTDESVLTRQALKLTGNGTLLSVDGRNAVVENNGTIDASGSENGVLVAGESASFINNGLMTSDWDGAPTVAINVTGGTDASAINTGTITSGGQAIAMQTSEGAVINQGIIDLTGSAIGLQVTGGGTAINDTTGTINIYSDSARAFNATSADATLINRGTINYLGSAVADGDPHTGLASINHYTIGTQADGSAGRLLASNIRLDGVSVDTGFTAGTSATQVTLDNVIQGENIQGAGAITSTSVVWNAQGSLDSSGNVDVTMSKNAYAEVATDTSVSSVAQALDAGYTNNALYNSLNVSSSAELNKALRQIGGSQATAVSRQTRMLSNRFAMLSASAPAPGEGLAFNVVTQGDTRAKLGKNTDFDMLALRQSLSLAPGQTLAMEYGIARLDGNGSQTAGNNGITGGYSQFFGLKHQMAFDNGLSWSNALRYDVHNLDSNRTVAYGDVSASADSSAKQQSLEFRSEGAKTFTLQESLKLTPYAGLKLRHQREGGYQEHNAGDFNLNMTASNKTAVDGLVGLKLDYAASNGWSATATLEGGPNLRYAQSQRSATLAGAGNQRFSVDDGQRGGGVNHQLTTGVKYSSQNATLQLDAFHWKEDGISDKGLILNLKKTF